MTATATRHPAGLTRGIAIALALWLAACSSTPDNKQISLQLPQLALPRATAQAPRWRS